MDGALDPDIEQMHRQHAREQERQAQAQRDIEAAAQWEAFTAQLREATLDEEWGSWVWPEEVPDYVQDHIASDTRRHGPNLEQALDIIQRVNALDNEEEPSHVEAACDHYGFDMDDVERAFRDRSMAQYDDAESYAMEFTEGMGEIPQWLQGYIDYEKMGKDMLMDVSYAELPNGRLLIFRD